MNGKKIILPLLLLLLSQSLLAQRRNSTVIQAYPVIGATFSQIEGDYIKGFKKKGFTGGVGAMIPLNYSQTLALSVEASYSERGARENSSSADVQYRLLGFTLPYVDIPIMLYYRDPIGGIQVGLGLSYSRLVQQPHGEIIYRPSYVVPDTSDLTFLKNDLAIVGAIRFPVWKHLKFDLRCQYSLIPIKRGWSFVDYSLSPSGLPTTITNDCYNFSISARLLWLFGEPDHYRPVKKKK